MLIYVHSSAETFGTELFELARIFYPAAQRTSLRGEGPDMLAVEHTATGNSRMWADRLSIVLPSGKRFEETIRTPHDEDALVLTRQRKRGMKTRLYGILRQETGCNPPWGSLTGVRPTRLLAERIDAGESPMRAAVSMAREFDVSHEKMGLVSDVYWMQRALLDASDRDIDIYVGIPFCPTVCDYCSFGSTPIKSYSPLQVSSYVEAVRYEISSIQPMLRDMGFRARCVYIGGGTPTALPNHLLENLLWSLRGHFHEATEWTVEAGRPDTMDNDCLAILRDTNIDRISINPQTMNDMTLRRIGRAHTATEVIDAFRRARPLFPVINMDIIAALPGETLYDVMRTLDVIETLRPENLTVHTLAIKRASKLHEKGVWHDAKSQAAEMVAAAAHRARGMGLLPYYLYRQKSMAGGLENVGYAKPGSACRYNVDIMEETVAIAAFGAGGISKALLPGRRIERAPNVRNVAEYISRIEEMIARKHALWQMKNR